VTATNDRAQGVDQVDLQTAREMAQELATVAHSLFALLQPPADGPPVPVGLDDDVLPVALTAEHPGTEEEADRRSTALLGEIGFLDD
jgi:hypothetical protein